MKSHTKAKLLKLKRTLSKKVENKQSHVNTLQKDLALRNAEVEFLNTHDSLTKLPNNLALIKLLETKEYHYLILFDISNFSLFNKEHGKHFADKIIARVAQTLEIHIRKEMELLKSESDRFIILSKIKDREQIQQFCAQILSFFDQTNFHIEDKEINVTFCIGAGECQNNNEPILEAEYALDNAKKLGPRHFYVYDKDIDLIDYGSIELHCLGITKQLILNNDIVPYYQAIANIKTRKIYKYEVLARGFYQGEMITPDNFIKSAERLGLITSVTRMMINKSFEFFEHNTHEFSLNITQWDLLENYLIDFMNEKLARYNIEPSRVCLEVLEQVSFHKDNSETLPQLRALQEMGFKVAVDDFGVDNSNFSRLLEIKMDYIKLDAVFIKDLEQHPNNQIIVKAICSLAHTMGIKTVAEYVSSKEIYEIIKGCDIDYAQGYYIGKPQADIIEEDY